MHLGRRSLLAAAALVLSASAISASAQTLSRTFVSRLGDDTNNCSSTAPCASFARAIVQTTANGEVDAIDQGSFGGFTVTGPITIDGGSQAAGVNSGITVNASGATVTLRNLNIQSAVGNSGTQGISLGAGTLHVEKVTISGFANGILVNGGTALTLDHVTSRDNSNSGLFVQTAATVNVHDSNFLNTSAGAGVFLGSGSFSTLRNVVSFGNGTAGVAVDGSGGTAQLALVNSTISSNAGPGLRVGGSSGSGSSVARVTGNSIFLNANAVTIQGGGLVGTYGDNEFGGLITGGSVTSLQKQ